MTDNKKILNPYFLPQKSGLNKYFSYMGETFSNSNEQNIINSLIVEQIQQFGIKAQYILRNPNNLDPVFGESAGSNFEKSFEIEMIMMDPISAFEGRDNIQPFGYNMHDNIVLQCSFSRMNEEFEKLGIPERHYPNPGDLLYIPSYKTMLEIRFIDNKNPSQPAGISVLYEFTCHMFNYNTETFTTDIKDIDIINEFNEIYYDNEMCNTDIQNEADDIIIEEPNAWKTLLKQVSFQDEN